ncbi:hypothetical protein V6N13_080287 [Hibiscus sabdariffa]|uniref:Nudix hydrolase domain-containing protein n=1 Tax=Hibiscus sabdariffa TaxID=183260 RepID=A0ABR2PXV3_9ROSI
MGICPSQPGNNDESDGTFHDDDKKVIPALPVPAIKYKQKAWKGLFFSRKASGFVAFSFCFFSLNAAFDHLNNHLDSISPCLTYRLEREDTDNDAPMLCSLQLVLVVQKYRCIPYRLENDAEESRISVLMISTPNRDDLVFPKGGWEDDETVHEAACREALEEAGVKGILDEDPLGVWEFRSKSRQNSCSLEGGCRGYMFAMEVTEELDSWAEHITYNRKWLSPEEAYKLCRYDWMREALGALLRGMEKNNKIEREHQMISAGCSANPSNLEESFTNKCIVQG